MLIGNPEKYFLLREKNKIFAPATLGSTVALTVVPDTTDKAPSIVVVQLEVVAFKKNHRQITKRSRLPQISEHVFDEVINHNGDTCSHDCGKV